MPSSNQFKALATGGGANALTPTAYAALTSLLANGYQSGTASSQQINTTLRQATFVATAVAQAMADTLATAVNDDGVIANFQAQFINAVKAMALTQVPAPSVPSGSRVTFNQASAPTGWVQDSTDIANNRMMRVTAGGGGGSGGSYDPTYNANLVYHTHSFTTDTRNIDHVHYDAGHAHTVTRQEGWSYRQSGGTDNGIDGPGTKSTAVSYASIGGMSGNQTHFHQGTVDSNGAGGTWYPRYVDLIICQKS